MANPQPTTHGRNQYTGENRAQHLFGAPTIGRIFSAVFVQPLTMAERTVEIVRFQGATAWKARIKETGAIITRSGQQAEFASDDGACRAITDMFSRQGLRIIRQWEAVYPEWSGAAVSPAHRPMNPGGVQQ